MSIHICTYSIPKDGNQASENQDASWPRCHPRKKSKPLTYKDKEIPKSGYIFAVSDGASEGLFSGLWARTLASRATPRTEYKDNNSQGLNLDILQQWVSMSLNVWGRFMKRRKHTRMKLGVPLTRLPSWIEEPALEDGGFATLAALQIKPKGIWSAFAVGDSCIFHVRSNKLLLSFPIKDPIEFENRPYLLGSVCGIDSETKIRLRFSPPLKKKNRWKSGDRFYIMSDAIACCFLERCKDGQKPWIELDSLGSTEADTKFRELVKLWKNEYKLRNDDFTLVSIIVK